MKRNVVMIILGIIVVITITCGILFVTNKKGNNDDISNKSWENLDIYVDGEWMSFPMSFEKMQSYGWELPEKYADKKIEGTMAYQYELINKNKDYKLGVSILNYNKETKNIKDCMIAGISVGVQEWVSETKSYKEKDSHVSIKIPSGKLITFGMNSDDIIRQLGNESTDKCIFSRQEIYQTSYTDNTKTLAYTDYSYTIKTAENYSRILRFSVYPKIGILSITLVEQIR